MPRVSDLRFKIKLMCGAFRLKSDEEFAKAIGVTAGTVSDYLKDGLDEVPEIRIEAIAKLIARRLPGRITPELARIALLSDLGSFQLAIAPYPASAFGNLLHRTAPSVHVAMYDRSSGRALGAFDDEPPPIDPKKIIPAKTRYELSVSRQRPGAFLVILIQCALGWHFAVPRDPEPVRISPDGSAREPERGLKFPTDGPHTFHAFVIQARLPPSIISFADQPSPLNPADLDAFAIDLESRGTKFAMGRLSVFVKAES